MRQSAAIPRVLIALSLTTSLIGCKTGSTLARPTPPGEATAYCERLPDVRRGMTLDDILRWAGITVETYNRCAARHKALSDWARGK